MGLLIWAIINWVTNVIPDFVCVFIMCCAWVLLGIVPFSTAFGSFSGTTVWLLIAAMGIGAAVTKSGLLARVALCIMRICPPTFKGQVLALLGSGVVIGPFIPSTIAKVSIVGAMATDIGSKLGFENRSKGMSGLWSAMYAGYTLLSQGGAQRIVLLLHHHGASAGECSGTVQLDVLAKSYASLAHHLHHRQLHRHCAAV